MSATGRMHPALRLWLAWGHAIRLYHRYETRGLEQLDGPGAKLIVGYHGRAYAHDMIALNAALYRRQGRIPRSVVHAAFKHGSFGRWFFIDGLEFVTSDSPALQEAVDRGMHIIVVPGGVREANRPMWVRYKVDWGERTGFIKLALRYKLPIIPVAASGVDDTYLGLNDGYRWGKRLGLRNQVPFWLGLGPLGLAPFSPPFPAKIRQLIGAPIHLEEDGPVDINDRAALIEQSRRVQGVVQRLLDHARATR